MSDHQLNLLKKSPITYYPELNSSFEVTQAESGRRLDRVLAERFPRLSRNAWKSHIGQGAVLVNKRAANKSLELRPGWQVSFLVETATPAALLPDPELAAKLRIIHRDAWLVVVDKPAGVPSHPLLASESGTIANALAALDPGFLTSGPKALEAGLVHRLDIQTSGLLMAACTPEAHQALTSLFRQHLATKRYLAIVLGKLDRDRVIEFPIAHHASDPKRMVAIQPGQHPATRGMARPARSQILVMESLSGMTVVQVTVEQAQMHQIRVHLSAIGHPLVGDAIYGPAEPAEGWPGGLKRHALHAWQLDLPHPSGHGRLALKAAIPDDLSACIQAGGGACNLF